MDDTKTSPKKAARTRATPLSEAQRRRQAEDIARLVKALKNRILREMAGREWKN